MAGPLTRPLKKRLRRLAVLATAGYVGVTVTLLLLEDTLLYRPHSHGEHWSDPPAALHVEEVWLRRADGIPVHAWWCPLAESKTAVLFCHGNAGNLSNRGHDVLAIQSALGRSVLIFDYPGFGRSGGEPGEAGCYAAADAAYEWLAQRVPPEGIVILGQSLGGGVAVDLASRHAHGALSVFKTFTSFPDLAQSLFPVLPARWLVHNQFNSLDKIRRCAGPVFIAHGDSDHLIPIAEAEQLYAAAPEPKRFQVLPSCGHHGGMSPALLTGLAEFLKEIKTDRNLQSESRP